MIQRMVKIVIFSTLGRPVDQFIVVAFPAVECLNRLNTSQYNFSPPLTFHYPNFNHTPKDYDRVRDLRAQKCIYKFGRKAERREKKLGGVKVGGKVSVESIWLGGVETNGGLL
jgi:hypothetical protein